MNKENSPHGWYKKPTVWLLVLALVFVAVVAVFLLTDPTQKEQIFVPDDENVYTDYEGVYLSYQTRMTDQDGNVEFCVLWHNETDTEILFGEWYTFQYLQDGQWVSVLTEEMSVHDIANALMPDSTCDKKYSAKPFDLSRDGRYRLYCTFWAGDGKEYATWIEFDSRKIERPDENEIGVQDVSAMHGDGVITLCFDCLWADGKYSVRNVAADEGEYVGDGMIAYDGSLGKYRVLVTFGDDEPSEALQSKLPVGQTVTIDGLKFKRVHPSDHGFAVYVGSDSPISVEEQTGTLQAFDDALEIQIQLGK